MYHPQETYYENNASVIKLRTSEGDIISARYMQVEGAPFIILHSHGNAEDLGVIHEGMEDFVQNGFSIIGYDYPGYGTSSGKPSEEGNYAAAEAVYNYLTDGLKISPDRIILYGRSLGGGPTLELATKKPCAGVITEGAFVTAYRVVTIYPIIFWDQYRNIQKIQKLKVPVLIIHATWDKTIFIWHGKMLYEKAPEPKKCVWVKGAGHNNIPEHDPEAYWGSIKKFVNKIESGEYEKASSDCCRTGG